MDGIILQLNRTKKLFIIMVLTTMVISPLSAFITFLLFQPPFEGGPGFHERGPMFFYARLIPLGATIVWLGIGIRQWFVLSKWTKKYETYKELQRKIDEKLDFEGGA
ncbi:MAG: hypothetical protein ABI361_06015 [Nitrososphaera sp.]|jgi:hypothetical protein